MNVPVYLRFVRVLNLCVCTDLYFIFRICFYLIDRLLDVLYNVLGNNSSV